MTAPHTDVRLRQVAAALAAPDRHIPPTAPTGIDPAALRRAVGLFRSAVFAGYFHPRPVEGAPAGPSYLPARPPAAINPLPGGPPQCSRL